MIAHIFVTVKSTSHSSDFDNIRYCDSKKYYTLTMIHPILLTSIEHIVRMTVKCILVTIIVHILVAVKSTTHSSDGESTHGDITRSFDGDNTH